MSTITLQKRTIQKKGGIVVLDLKEYEKLVHQATIPTYYLQGRKAKELDELVDRGLKEHKAGKTRKIKSLQDLD